LRSRLDKAPACRTSDSHHYSRRVPSRRTQGVWPAGDKSVSPLLTATSTIDLAYTSTADTLSPPPPTLGVHEQKIAHRSGADSVPTLTVPLSTAFTQPRRQSSAPLSRRQHGVAPPSCSKRPASAADSRSSASACSASAAGLLAAPVHSCCTRGGLSTAAAVDARPPLQRPQSAAAFVSRRHSPSIDFGDPNARSNDHPHGAHKATRAESARFSD